MAHHHASPAPRSFFGNFGFGGFGFGQQEEEAPKGNNVVVELEVSLKDLYLGGHFKVRGTTRPQASRLTPLGGGRARPWVCDRACRPALHATEPWSSRTQVIALSSLARPLARPRRCSSSATGTW